MNCNDKGRLVNQPALLLKSSYGHPAGKKRRDYPMRGAELVRALKRKLNVKTDRNLAERIGLSVPGIQTWKRRRNVTARQVSSLVSKAYLGASKSVQSTAIKPLVEFYRIERCGSKQGKKFELFTVFDGTRGKHPYRNGLKEELCKHRGVYVFYDSRGQAIYTGKARKQTLWKEMTSAFNRDRGSVQMIKRVRHPINKVTYRTSEEKSRQINPSQVPLHDLAAYFSAYQVLDGMIDELEAFLVRSFANDLLNKRMERFGRARRAALLT